MKTRLSAHARPSGISLALLVPLVVLAACQAQKSAPTGETLAKSSIVVTLDPAGPMLIKTQAAEFEVWPSGYVQGGLHKDGKRLTLDSSPTVQSNLGNLVTVDGKEVRDFLLDLTGAKATDGRRTAAGPGKVISLSGSSQSYPNLAETMEFEVWDESPTMLTTKVSYVNKGSSPLEIRGVQITRRRLDASLADAGSAPYQMWGFFGTSYDWGKDNVLRIPRVFSQANVMGAISPSGGGGGVPVVALWTSSVGEAIGHLDPKPNVLSIPVRVENDQQITASVVVDAHVTLQPGESYSSPRTFVAVYAGDFYEPLSMYSRAMARRGWKIPTPTHADYEANWCGWGYRSDVTPAQMLGTIPKLKELGFKWATLDYRWFNNFGDWEPRPETFSRESIKKVVDEYHRQGIKLQLWWLPLAISDGQPWEPIGPEERTPAAREQQKHPAKVLEEHPDWLILDRTGKLARLFLNRAALCPALTAVQEYHRKLTEKFIREWDFDGHKLDMCFTMPACYNPRHKHASPQESILAMGEVFKAIFETTRRLKPESVTQICPCGTSPNIAWLPFMDQAVTADPVGAFQVRHRIKMYKALLGPQAAVYGDHVELSEMRRVGKEYVEGGADFASTVGTGAVLGTKFTWPDYGAQFQRVYLTPEKEVHWKKWIRTYNSKMLSQGTFLNLYTIGYDIPEGYAIAKAGKMYYAFFSPDPRKPWKGEVELRGLEPGRYRVTDFIEGKELGSVTAPNARLAAEFTHSLLLEASRL